MDKRVIFAVAGSGKTTHIVENLSGEKRSLIVTYTTNNYENLRKKITEQFDGKWPDNIVLMTYFHFLYNFCYKPFGADKIKARGILFNPNIVREEQEQKQKRGVSSDRKAFYMSGGKYFYNNRLAFFINKYILNDVKERIIKYFDEFVIDEVQDIAGRDFTLLEGLMTTDTNILFVGDFYQHTFDTSRDGNANGTLYDDKAKYEARFANHDLFVDDTTLIKSRRCSKSVCDYIRDNLGIAIVSNRSEEDNTLVEYVTNAEQINAILNDNHIIKLHYQNGVRIGVGHTNWGESKGEDCYCDVCVMLNKTTATKLKAGRLNELSPATKNKLYVAITRAHGNVYFVDE